MNTALWLSIVFVSLGAFPIEPPVDSVVDVDFAECMKHSKGLLAFRARMVDELESVEDTAREKLDAIKVAQLQLTDASDNSDVETLKRTVSTLEAEFFVYRREQQTRLKEMERKAFNDALDEVRKAVAKVAAQNGYSIVLFRKPNEPNQDSEVDKVIEAKELIDSPPQIAFIAKLDRKDVTDAVTEVMSSTAD